MMAKSTFISPSMVVKIITSKWLWAIVVLVSLLGWHFTHKNNSGDFSGFGGGKNKNITSVGIALVEKADMPILLNTLGTVTATGTATVRAQVSGVLTQVNFQEGQMVKAGQLLASIDARAFEYALMQASGQRLRDEAQLDNARLVLARDKSLLIQDSIASQDVETQAALVKQLEGTAMADRAQELNARLNLSYTKIIAPVSGRIGLRVVDVGNLVSANDTGGIAVITQLAPIDVEFAIPQAQVADVLSAATHALPSDDSKISVLKITALDQSRTNVKAQGEFLALDNQVDTQTGTVKAKARFANDHLTLFPNQFVNISVILRTINDAIVVPIAALRHSNKEDFVYVLNADSQTVTQRSVMVGQANADKVQITSGVKVGEQVITEGADRLKDGAKVNLPIASPTHANADSKSFSEQKSEWKNRNNNGNSNDVKKQDGKGEDESSSSATGPTEHRHRHHSDAS